MSFSKINVNKVEWLNLVFANRNQSYGAYVLRRDSGSYLFKSLLLTIFLFVGVILLFTLQKKITVDQSSVSQPTTVQPDVVSLRSVDILMPQPQTNQAEIVKPALGKTKSKLRQVKFSGLLNPVKDNLVSVEAPTIKQILQSVIGVSNQEGLVSEGVNIIAGSSSNSDGVGSGLSDGTDIYNTSFLEAMPEFPGGTTAWTNYLTKNLYYPVFARESGVGGRVVVSFVVEKSGEITDLKVLQGIGGGCDEEAMRVIKKSPFWKPGMQNGKRVRVSYVMPIVFRME